jgi:2-polyprenyl-6-hydroxyphenyl methylase/3-demethylubiquinone-9 3-methyltransferase
MAGLPAEVPPQVACKCCGTFSPIYGAVDFNKNCEAAKNSFPLPPAGIPIYYHRCPACGLVFTVGFDQFSAEDFATHIYNDQYALVDPSYAQLRPVQNARAIIGWFGRWPQISILDYGGGNGKLVEMLHPAGFRNTATYDPFVSKFSILPERKFQLVLAFEVMEHSPTPMQTLEQMASLRADDGIILFSTQLQPANFDQIGLNWWYAAPRNGHVTLYSAQSLQEAAKKLRLRLCSMNVGLHILFTTVPDFARNLLRVNITP